MMAEKVMVQPRLVRRPFNGPTLAGDPGVFRYKPGMVVDVDEWRNAAGLERTRYLRKLEYGEEFIKGPHGVHYIVKSGAKAGAHSKAGRERASSPQTEPENASPAASEEVESADIDETTETEQETDEAEEEAPEATVEESDEGSEDETESEADADAKDAPEVQHIGGGWYNVLVGSKVINQKPIQGKPQAQEFAESL